ncbi:tetratricopeptide repeat protein [Planctobacterium marinum]|uniref:Tetratricopeptide repeat protein n=1 Tax=Planctobacterium marinum TaxID=1631968 RepID=A0AA48HU16_9ALTE|nr:hypothetical protein MACH26_13690 [Planctobacterium marinum]
MMKRAILNRQLFVLLAVALIQACATVAPVSVDFQPEQYDAFFPGFENVETIPQDTIFYLNDKSKAYVRERAAMAETSEDKALTLINDLMSPSQLALDYVYGANTVAQETFDNGTANCLSLTILAYAMAQEAELDVRFQEVFEQESWNQAGEFDLANGHVNLLVARKPRFSFVPGMVSQRRTYTVDFFPESREGRAKTKELSKTQIESYFYSNIGARAMIDGQYNRAWANFRIALSLFPQDSSAWNNLALLLSRQGALNEAIVALQTATELDNKNTSAWENLAGMLKKSGDTEAAENISERLNRIRLDNPNHHVRLGNRHFLNEDWQEAENAYRKSLRLQNNNHLAWFGLAKVAAQAGDEQQVREYLSKAKESANSEGFARRYARKLHALNETL